MKYKLFAILSIVVMLVVAFAASSSAQEVYYYRTHQHLEYAKTPAEDPPEGEFSTHLPIISIDLNGAEPDIYSVLYPNGFTDRVSTYVPGVVSVFESLGSYNTVNDEPSLQATADVRYRGTSSMSYDKVGYKINLVNLDGSENKDNSLLGMEPHDEWALHGPYADRSLIRNYLSMNIAGQIMPYTPDVRFCELFVNGDYKGLYLVMETVAKSEGRVDLRTYREGDAEAGFLVKLDWHSETSKNISPFVEYTDMVSGRTSHEVLYPSNLLNEEIQHEIEQDLSDYEKSLYSFDFNDDSFGYPANYNTQSFIDYAITNEFFQNYEAPTASTFFYQDVGGKLSIGPVWDFNFAFDNYPGVVNVEDFKVLFDVRYVMLMKDEDFVDRLIDRYRELRKTVLNEDYLLNYVDETVDFLGPSVYRNFEVWNNLFDYSTIPAIIRMQPDYRNPDNYTEAVEMLKTYLVKRGSWLDEHIETLKQFSHYSATKKYKH